VWLGLSQRPHALFRLRVTFGVGPVPDDPDGSDGLLGIYGEDDASVPITHHDLPPYGKGSAQRVAGVFACLLKSEQLLEEERQVTTFGVTLQVLDGLVDQLDADGHGLPIDLAQIVPRVTEPSEDIVQ
jgi:hypothetical protein